MLFCVLWKYFQCFQSSRLFVLRNNKKKKLKMFWLFCVWRMKTQKQRLRLTDFKCSCNACPFERDGDGILFLAGRRLLRLRGRLDQRERGLTFVLPRESGGCRRWRRARPQEARQPHHISGLVPYGRSHSSLLLKRRILIQSVSYFVRFSFFSKWNRYLCPY